MADRNRSRLTRQHGGEQSGLVTLKVVSKSRVTWATSEPILSLPIACLSVIDLDSMYATDVREPTVCCSLPVVDIATKI